MIKSTLAAFIAAMSTATAQAGEVQSLVAEGSDGVAAVIYADAGNCLADARRAEFVMPNASKIPGCWKKLDGGTVQIVFMDGDYLQLPMSRFKPAQVL